MLRRLNVVFGLFAIAAIALLSENSEAQVFRNNNDCRCQPQVVRVVQPPCQPVRYFAAAQPANRLLFRPALQSQPVFVPYAVAPPVSFSQQMMTSPVCNNLQFGGQVVTDYPNSNSIQDNVAPPIVYGDNGVSSGVIVVPEQGAVVPATYNAPISDTPAVAEPIPATDAQPDPKGTEPVPAAFPATEKSILDDGT